jgi:hypothetical protein
MTHAIIINLVSALKCERAKNVKLQYLLKAIQAEHSTVDWTVYSGSARKRCRRLSDNYDMDDNDNTETERLFTWLKSQELTRKKQIQEDLKTLPEIDLSKALEKARMAVRSRIKALEDRYNRPPAEGG